jgi:hypothetical protein
MPPVQRPIPSFIAEQPAEPLPYGRWAETLASQFRGAFDEIEEEVGEAGEILWFPERTYAGRPYVPASTRTTEQLEVFGYVSFLRGGEDWYSHADWTDEVAEANPDWKLDLSDFEIGSWADRQVSLVWGVSVSGNGAIATAELGPTTTDQCELVEGRFTLVSLDGWKGDLLQVALFGQDGSELARESLFEDD